jgi:raffinose/stachyose/melibiose transport system permease protein
MKIHKAKNTITWAFVFLGAVVWLFITGTPFVFMILSAFKKQLEMLTSGVFALPQQFYLGNFEEVLKGGHFFNYFSNSVIVVGISLTILLLVSAFAAYPLSRFRFKLNKPIFGLIVAAMSVPIHVTLIPIFMMAKNLNIYDTIWALIGPYIAFNVPISVFILTTFMADIPKELEEAAQIDGCGRYKTFFSVIFPLVKPGLATLAIYNSVNMWNEFSFALVLTQSSESRTLPLATWEYQSQYVMNIPMIMTVLSLSVLPMIVAFLVGQDKLIKGMMVGAVKG